MNLDIEKTISKIQEGDLIVEHFNDASQEVYLISKLGNKYRLINLKENFILENEYDSINEILKYVEDYRIIKQEDYVLREKRNNDDEIDW